MEWTLDYERLQENPLLTSEGQKEIIRLSSEYSVPIPSVTGDCFMQVPFWKALKTDREHLKGEFITVVKASSSVGIKIVVVPLVDNGRLETPEQEDELVQFLTSQISLLAFILEVKRQAEQDPEQSEKMAELSKSLRKL